MQGKLQYNIVYGWRFSPDAEYINDLAFPINRYREEPAKKLEEIFLDIDLDDDELSDITTSSKILNSIEQVDRLLEEMGILRNGNVFSEKANELEEIVEKTEIYCTITIHEFYVFLQTDNEWEQIISVIDVTD